MKGNKRDLPRVLNQKTAKALLEAYGWVKERGGKHETKMVKEGARPVVLPHHGGGDYSPWLRHRILREAGLIGPDGQGGDRP